MKEIKADLSVINRVSKGMAVGAIISVKKSGRDWILLAGVVDPEFVENTEPPLDQGYSSVRLLVLRERRNRLMEISRAELPNDGNYDDTSLHLVDLDGDGRPEAIVYSMFADSCSITPIRFAAYKINNGELACVGQLKSTFGFALEQRGNQIIVEPSFGVGSEMGIAGEVRWTDLYADVNGRLKCLDARYPKRFETTRKELLEKLKAHPGDADLIAYAAECEAIQGRWSTARQLTDEAHKRFEVDFKDELKTSGPSKELTKSHSLNLDMIRAMKNAYSRKRIAQPFIARGDVEITPNYSR